MSLTLKCKRQKNNDNEQSGPADELNMFHKTADLQRQQRHFESLLQLAQRSENLPINPERNPGCAAFAYNLAQMQAQCTWIGITQ
jgi:hypothetical protein